jgi:hypothetical protein
VIFSISESFALVELHVETKSFKETRISLAEEKVHELTCAKQTHYPNLNEEEENRAMWRATYA